MANFCGKCGSRLDLDTGCCSNPQCEDYREPKKKIPRRLVILPILTLLMLLGLIWELHYFDLIEVPFFQCRHEWEEASCTEAKHCLKCEKTEGTALGHTPGKTETEYDIVGSVSIHKTFCDQCQQCISSERHSMESFSVNEMFVFSPEAFLERMTDLAKVTYPEFHYEIDDEYGFIYTTLYCYDYAGLTICDINYNNNDDFNKGYCTAEFRDPNGFLIYSYSFDTGSTLSANEAGYLSNIEEPTGERTELLYMETE